MCGKNIAIVTGASSGIGREFVKLLCDNKKIDAIWAIAREEDEPENAVGAQKVRVFALDLTDRRNFDVISSALESEKPNILYLINCAGFAKFCQYDDISVDVSINMIDLNISALVTMGLICLPYMCEGAHIINMASQAAFQPVPYQNIYSSTKAFVRNYTRALNVELRDRGICATAVCPGWMNTALIKRAKTGAKKATNKFPCMVEPRPVAQKALKDADKNKDTSVYGLCIKLAHVASKLLPQRLLMKLWLMQQGIK